MAHLNYCCVYSIRLDLTPCHSKRKLRARQLSSLSIDFGSCSDQGKPIPLLPFIVPIKNSSCPNGERSFFVSPLQTNCDVPG